MKKIFLLGFISLCFVSKNHAQDWISFNSTEGKFSAFLPSEPRQQTDSSKTYPAYITKMFISRANTDIFAIGWVDYETAYKFDDQKELEANRDNFLKGVNSTLIESKDIEFNGYKGLEFSAQGGGVFWTSKVFIVGKRPYQLVAGSTTGKASENENKFYNSFSISK